MVHWFLAPKSHGFPSAYSSWHSAFSQGQAPLLSLCFIPSDPLCKILCLFLHPEYTFVAIISEISLCFPCLMLGDVAAACIQV